MANKQFLQQALAQAPAFRSLAPAELEQLTQDALRLKLGAREHLFEMEDEAQHFYVVESGGIVLYRPAYDGDEKVFRVMQSTHVIAETVMFAEPGRYPVSARAQTASVVWRLSGQRLRELSHTVPELAFAFLTSISNRVHQSVNRIDLLTTGKSGQRLVGYLVSLHMQQGSNWLALPVNGNVLAKQLNVTPVTLSRLLSAFRREGLLGGSGRQLVLLDVAGLCKAVDLPVPEVSFGAGARGGAAGAVKPVKTPAAPAGYCVRGSRHDLGSGLFDCCDL